MEETLGHRRAAHLRRCHLRRLRDLPLPGWAGRSRWPTASRGLGQPGRKYLDDLVAAFTSRGRHTVYALALKLGVQAPWPPTDMPWNVRECHIRHPDGHTIRVSARLKRSRLWWLHGRSLTRA